MLERFHDHGNTQADVFLGADGPGNHSYNDAAVLEEIETFTIGCNADGTISEENGEALIDTSTRHHFVGAIVTFTQLEVSNR